MPNTYVTDELTSSRMAKVRTKNTAPEMAVRKALFGIGLGFRTKNGDLPGSPDVANRKGKWVVFVHGYFWHRHQRCKRASIPKRNTEQWQKKFERNVERDRRATTMLKEMGFNVVVVWECETKDRAGLERLLVERLCLNVPS